jgi:hypothetical protein
MNKTAFTIVHNLFGRGSHLSGILISGKGQKGQAGCTFVLTPMHMLNKKTMDKDNKK